MPSLNFKRQFAEAVANGTKRQTIRKRGKLVWKVGDLLHFFEGSQNGCGKRLGQATLLSVQQIAIDAYWKNIHLEKPMPYGGTYMVQIFPEEALALAVADGFASLDAFFEFFQEQHGRWMNGYLLKW